MAIKFFSIEVAYATSAKQRIIALSVESGCTLKEAILRSGILALFPEIDLSKQTVGVFSQAKRLDDFVNEGDRIEIYRPLIIDPKEARRKRGLRDKDRIKRRHQKKLDGDAA